MGRIIRSISLTKELDELVDEKIRDFSGYVQECLKRDFSEDFLQKEIESKKKELQELETKLASEKKNSKEEKKDTKEEEKYLKQMREHSKMFGEEEALKNYNNKFGKRTTMQEFREMIK